MISNIVGYKVCEANNSAQLTLVVMKAIEDGWQPHGSLAVIRTDGFGFVFHQAMVMIDLREGDE